MRWLVIILWFLLFWFYWKCQKKCCSDDSPVPVQTEAESVAVIEPIIRKLTPIRFECNSAKANVEPRWVQFKDSLLAELKDDQQLQIQGLYFESESTGDSENIGLRRAKNVLNLFDGLNSSRIELSSKVKGDSCLHSELNNLLAFRFLRKTEKIIETDDMTTIYFEFNSDQKIKDDEVEAYLDQLAKRLNKSIEKVRLIGHTDNEGSDAFNQVLGEKRATAISNYLVRRGINPNRITVDSRGRREPIASNDTDAGKAKNRRTEIIIVD